MRIVVDDDACAGHGVCVGLCPEVFELTDHGYARSMTGDIPSRLEGAVTEALAAFPEHAIHRT